MNYEIPQQMKDQVQQAGGNPEAIRYILVKRPNGSCEGFYCAGWVVHAGTLCLLEPVNEEIFLQIAKGQWLECHDANAWNPFS